MTAHSYYLNEDCFQNFRYCHRVSSKFKKTESLYYFLILWINCISKWDTAWNRPNSNDGKKISTKWKSVESFLFWVLNDASVEWTLSVQNIRIYTYMYKQIKGIHKFIMRDGVYSLSESQRAKYLNLIFFFSFFFLTKSGTQAMCLYIKMYLRFRSGIMPRYLVYSTLLVFLAPLMAGATSARVGHPKKRRKKNSSSLYSSHQK